MPKHYFAAMTRNKTSLVGTGLVIGSLTLMLSLLAIQVIGLRGGAYMGIITFVFLPTLLALGLLHENHQVSCMPLLWNQLCS